MPADQDSQFAEWIWIPAGFAHGGYFKSPTLLEYYCTGEYNSEGEVCVSPQSDDIDWSLCDKDLKKGFADLVFNGAIISEKDRSALSIADWKDDKRSDKFICEKLK